MRLPRRGTWTPLLPIRSRALAVGVVPLVPLAYGIDYLLPRTTQWPDSYSVIEQQLPLQVWGVMHLVAAITTLIGLTGRWPRITIAGCMMTGAVLCTMAVGRMAAVIEQPWWDGISGPAIVGAIGIASWAMAAGYTLQIAARKGKR